MRNRLAESPSKLQVWLARIHKVEDLFLCALLGLMIFLAFGQIVLRNLFDTGVIWGDALLRNLVLWVGLTGAAIATRQDRHITVDIASQFLDARWNAALRVVTDSFACLVSLAVAWAGYRFIAEEIQGGMKAFASVPAWVMESIIPLAFSVIALRFGLHAIRHLLQAMKGDMSSGEAN